MGLFNKLKDVLFVEEEVEIPVIDKVSEKVEEEPVHETAPKKFDNTLPEFEETNRMPVVDKVEEPKENINHFSNVKRDIEFDYGFDLEDDKTEELNLEEDTTSTKVAQESPFLSFDEEEFEKLNASIRKEEPKTPTYTAPKKEEVKPMTKEEKEQLAPKKFRLSPIISPVYGILDKNYKKEDIVEKVDDVDLYEEVESAIDVDVVRRKAYGTLEDEIESKINHTNEMPIVKEEVEEENDELDIPLVDVDVSIEDNSLEVAAEVSDIEVEEPKEGQFIEQSVEEDIDDVIDEDDIEDNTNETDLEDTLEIEVSEKEDDIPVLKSEEEIEIPSFEEINETNEENDLEMTPNDILEKTNTLKILDDIEKELDEVTTEHKEKKEKDKEVLLEDTTETDLFNLIDSMYNDKEEE